MKPALVLIGPGRVGCAIGHLLHQAGYPIAAVIGRDQNRTEEAAGFIGCGEHVATTDLQAAAQGDILLLALPDDRLSEFSAHLCDKVALAAETTLIHFSGLLPAAIMSRKPEDIALLSIHPLLPFADRQLAVANLKDCPCAIEGDLDRHQLGEELVAAFGGEAFLLPTEAKQIYHAAASIASNFMVGLTACARDLLGDCGFDSQQAMRLLGPIHRTTSTNILELGPEQALTGPIVRGDAGSVAMHLNVLSNRSVEIADLYRGLAKETLKLALNSGRLAADKAEEIRLLLEE
jgi:predicted short-subunit dehydrogenase-like oxidoreductase (DUF2520 family)